MPSQEDIDRQLEILSAHRRTLHHYLIQLAKVGKVFARPELTHGIDEARQSIRLAKAVLRDWGTLVEELPIDEEATAEPVSSAIPRVFKLLLVCLTIAIIFFLFGSSRMVSSTTSSFMLPEFSTTRDTSVPGTTARGHRTGLFVGSCPGFYQVLGDLMASGSTSQVQRLSSFNRSASTLVPDQKGTIRILVDVVNNVNVEDYITPMDVIDLSVTTKDSEIIKEDMNINIVDVLTCNSTDEEKEFPLVPLDTQFDSYNKKAQLKRSKFPPLSHQEKESFFINLQCRKPGVYKIDFKLPFTTQNDSGHISLLGATEVICPIKFSLWETFGGDNIRFVGIYIWNGSAYSKK